MTVDRAPRMEGNAGAKWMRRLLFAGLGMAAGALFVAAILGLYLKRVFDGNREESIPAKINADLAVIHRCAESIFAGSGKYPASIEEMARPRDDSGKPKPFALDVPADPWGRRYLYRLEEGKPVIECLGKDGLPGGEGLDADLRYP